MNLTDISKFLSLVLRHKPEEIGITLDEHGWANVNEILKGMNITKGVLDEIVKTDNKQRYSYNEDQTLIRANQGHSIPVDVELKEVEPPEFLYHGTGMKYVNSIDKDGLIHKSRLYVHLSADIETAMNVGKRHGQPVIYKIKSAEMQKDGYKFYCSVNGVWLTDAVPVKYLEKQDIISNNEINSEFTEYLYKFFLENKANLCDWCQYNPVCGKDCDCYENLGDHMIDPITGKERKFLYDIDCMELEFGTCKKLAGTQCNGCFQDKLNHFSWDGTIPTDMDSY